MDCSINLLFSLPGMVNCSFSSHLITHLFFFFFFSVYLNYLNGARNPELQTSLWSKITFPLKLLYLKASSKLLTNFLFPYNRDSSSFLFLYIFSLYSLLPKPFLLSVPLQSSLFLLERLRQACLLSSVDSDLNLARMQSFGDQEPISLWSWGWQ